MRHNDGECSNICLYSPQVEVEEKGIYEIV